MANQYGMVETMERTYRNHKAAVDAGLRHAKSTGQPCYVGMLYDLKFHLTDENPIGDWRWGVHLECLPTGKTHRKGR